MQKDTTKMTITSRIDAITRIAPEYQGTILPAPKSCKIEVTARCNLACKFCGRSLKLRDQQDMDRKLFERLAVEMHEAGVEELGLFYLGESLMLPNLADYVRFAKEEAAYGYVFLTTNGSLATGRRCGALFNAGLDSLKFSLNYADPEQFEDISGMPKKLFPTMIGNIKAAQFVRDKVERETGHRCGLYASYIEYDGEQGERMKSVVAEVSPFLDEVYALPLYSQAEFVGDSEREKGWNVTAGNRGRVGVLRDPLPCWATMTEAHVTAAGRLSACCFDHNGSWDMGDLTKDTFLNCWNSEKFQALRAAHLRKDVTGTPCQQCVAYS